MRNFELSREEAELLTDLLKPENGPLARELDVRLREEWGMVSREVESRTGIELGLTPGPDVV
jgi:hypothetical protein